MPGGTRSLKDKPTTSIPEAPSPRSVPYRDRPLRYLDGPSGRIASFVLDLPANADPETVAAFGDEWERYSEFDPGQVGAAGDEYFDIVPAEAMGPDCTAIDVGCGSGRWALYIAPRVGFVEAIDPSAAALVAARTLAGTPNARVTQGGFGAMPFPAGSFDLAFSLGVVHHVPDTRGALHELVELVRPGGYVLVYIYYKLDNRSVLYRALFHASNALRRVVSRLPPTARFVVCDALALLAYAPLILIASAVRRVDPAGRLWPRLPLSYYVGKSWRFARNDALDRFGTPLEQRFSRAEITEMLTEAGLTDLQFSERQPYWHVVGRRR